MTIKKVKSTDSRKWIASSEAEAGKPVARKPNAIQWQMETADESEGKAHARLMASPSVHAATTIYNYHPLKDGCDITALLDEVGKHALDVRGGDMRRPEAMLVAQAHSLDTIFNALAQKAAENMRAGYMGATETYLRMALKAQSQCRTTIEAIAEIKCPKSATFIKQANVGQNVQVNNGQADSRSNTHERAHEKTIPPTNELLTESPHATLDTRGAGAASGINSELEAVGAVNRPKNQLGQDGRSQ